MRERKVRKEKEVMEVKDDTKKVTKKFKVVAVQSAIKQQFVKELEEALNSFWGQEGVIDVRLIDKVVSGRIFYFILEVTKVMEREVKE